jgi:ubiquinone biosynthesis protein COQ9
VKTYGFSREALARSVLCLGTSTSTGSHSSTSTERTHAEPLSDTAVSALFGSGDEARRRLIDMWLEEGLRHMETRARTLVHDRASVRDALHARLAYNEPVLGHLPEVRLG